MRIQPKQIEDAAEHQHISADHPSDKLGDQILYLSDVVGHSGHQRTRAEAIHLREGEGHQIAEGILSYFIAHILPSHVDKGVVQRAAQPAEKNQTDHLQPQRPDQPHISHAAGVNAQNTIVHNLAHDLWLKQVHQHFSHHKYGGECPVRQIPFDVLPHFIHHLDADRADPNVH